MDSIEAQREFLKADPWKQWADGGDETDQRKGIPRPAPEKPYPRDAKLVDLVAPERFGVGKMPVVEAIARRQSRREYTGGALSLEELSFLLWATQGVREISEGRGGVVTFRTVPSGGACHALETYLFIDRVDGVPSGLYRYLPLEHKLLFLRSEPDLREKVTRACLGNDFVEDAAAVFMWTTIPYRMEWRYTVVAHKMIAIDAGHVCQNLYLACEAIGAGTCAIAAYDQEKMDAVLGMDGRDEFAVYAAPVGKVER